MNKPDIRPHINVGVIGGGIDRTKLAHTMLAIAGLPHGDQMVALRAELDRQGLPDIILIDDRANVQSPESLLREMLEKQPLALEPLKAPDPIQDLHYEKPTQHKAFYHDIANRRRRKKR